MKSLARRGLCWALIACLCPLLSLILAGCGGGPPAEDKAPAGGGTFYNKGPMKPKPGSKSTEPVPERK
jgi:hypothetical protein